MVAFGVLSGLAEASVMIGVGLGSGATSGVAAAGVDPNNDANRLRFLGGGGAAG